MSQNATKASALQTLRTDCLPDGPLPDMLRNDVRPRRQMVNRQDVLTWEQLQNREDWENFATPRINALRDSLGDFPTPPASLNIHKTGEYLADDYAIENLIFESRPGIYVTANLYRPDPVGKAMPGILLIHSHHNPRFQVELQDMGILWAKSGCQILVMDQFAYGERGQHQPGPRQDYRFRYITASQLHTIGDSLMGWMIWDIHRGVDLLLARAETDPAKIIVMGSVAGGGDPAAAAAALDERITCAVPFNFGGPQPESPYPLPEDADQTFDYLGSGSWESTRNLRLSGRDGFLPWVIVGSIAPRRLIYAHEFAWDQERDPVWKRLLQIYAWCNASDHLDHTQGFGELKGRPPHASHCNNIGPAHRRRIYAALNRWFDIPIPEEAEYRHPEDVLKCLTPEFEQTISIPPVHKTMAQIGKQRAQTFQRTAGTMFPETRRAHLCDTWQTLLGDIAPREPSIRSDHSEKSDDITIHRTVLETDPNIQVPLLILRPENCTSAVIGISQSGKSTFVKEDAETISPLLANRTAVILPDLRGTGETQLPGGRHPRSAASSISATEWMLGQTLLGARLRDLRTVIRYAKNALPKVPIALWGDGFAPTNPIDLEDPLMGDEPVPPHSEPLGGILALFAALFEKDIKAVATRHMIYGYRALLDATYCYIPHDIVIPGALTSGDLCDIASALDPIPLRIENLVDGRNCPVDPRKFLVNAKAPNNLTLAPGTNSADWFIQTLT